VVVFVLLLLTLFLFSYKLQIRQSVMQKAVYDGGNTSSPYQYPSLTTFGLNKTAAFIADFGNYSGSELGSELSAGTLNLPKIMMLDVQTGSITPFLELKYPDPNFTPIDLAFDYNNNALYVLSAGNNGDDDV
jgi:hypothetical protein